MAEGISLKGIDNFGNTIETCHKNSNKEDATLGTTSVNVCGTDASSNQELQATLTAQPGQHLKRNKYPYLIATFAVSTCIASIVCASIVIYAVLNSGDTVSTRAEGSVPTSISGDHPVNRSTVQCVSITELRLKAKDKMKSRYLDNNREFSTEFQPVSCLHIPQGNCSGVLPYAKTFIPNNHVDSFETAKNYLEEISGLQDCDTHALYVVCSWLYPPCITDTLQVVPCKGVCEGVVNGCQEIFNTTAIGSELSCDYSPVGEANEMDCRQSCSYNIYLNVGEVFQFTSPNYPLAFPSNTYCVWLITSPRSTRIKFKFTNVDLAEDFDHLQLSSKHNPYEYYKREVTNDIEVFTVLNWASVIFKSHNIVNMKRGFSAEVTAIDNKDALSCTGNWWDKLTFITSLNEDELCDGQENCEKYKDDEYLCRSECGYDVLLTDENSVEVLSSMNHSKAIEQCIYTFTSPTRTKLKMEFLSLKGAVSGCNFKMGAGTNPFNTTSEFTSLPLISTGIDLPGNMAWIWFAQTPENSSFVVRLSSFIESKIINIAANDSYIIDNNSHSINSWLEYGCLVFKSSSGYHFKLTFLNDILDLRKTSEFYDPGYNKIAFGLGSDPLKYNVFTLESDYDDMLELYTDAIWLKMDGYGPYAIGITISTILTREDYRTHILVKDVATITYPSSEIGNVEESSNVSTTVWIVTSIRYPNIAVKFINFSYGTSEFNFITIGHGVNTELSSSILFQGLALDFQRTLPHDLIIHYSTFWVRHTSYRRINDTRFSMELRGLPDRDNIICPTKTVQDICDDEFDCPDLRDEIGCVDPGISCGQRPLHPDVRTKRVIGGTEPLPGSWPWQGLIFYGDSPKCGCTLINELYVISASHCFSGSNNILDDIRVMFGSNKRLNFSANHFIVAVSLVYLLPGDIPYEHNDETDFVLMKLSRPVPFTNYIRPACISSSYNQFTENDVCYVTGFGVQGTGGPIVAMHEVPVDLFSSEKCNEFQGTAMRMTENEICAGRREGGMDTCQGDSGGPLVCLGEDEKWYLFGITSYGQGCAERFRPGVYHRVFPYLDFIDNILNAEHET